MKTYLECLPCFLRQALGAARAATDDPFIHRKVMDEVAGMIPGFPLDITPPEIAQHVYRAVYRITENDDPYRQTKKQSNERALSLYPKMKEIVEGSDDPLLTACKLAIAGNSIDLGPPTMENVDFDSLLESAVSSPLAYDNYTQLCHQFEKSSHILYLADNAGEIVFDKLLIEEICRRCELEITVAVRDKPTINDATMEDAVMAGLDEVAEVVSNGSDAPATILAQCSPQIQALFNSVDVIIAKGQGNYESLSDADFNIFFFLRAKCPVVAVPLNVQVGDAILKGRNHGSC
ncbi:MAG: ARMT1-like domain-containing protein [Dehalococcoidia bacterium]